MAFENGVDWKPLEPGKRGRHATFGSALDTIARSLSKAIDRDEFFDSLVENWTGLFPASHARPGRKEGDRIILYVNSAPVLFMMRPKLPGMKKVLLGLPGAPKRLSLLLEIRK